VRWLPDSRHRSPRVQVGADGRRAHPDVPPRQPQPPYEYEQEKLPIDILAGSDRLRKQIESDVPAREIATAWQGNEQTFTQLRRQFLLY
jgi:hypothetical protein